MELIRYADRQELLERRHAEISIRTFPEYLHHNAAGAKWWDRLYPDHPDFQVALVEGDRILAEGHSVPVAWDGTLEDLPEGWDAGFERAMTSDRPSTAVMALAISVLPERQGERLSSRMIEAFKEAGRRQGLTDLIAPVRPTLKDRYPLMPIERYIEWRRDDGFHVDPWIRIHERLGGRIIARRRAPCSSRPRSLTGRSGRRCASHSKASTPFRGRSRRWSSRAASAPMSSRTCGSITASTASLTLVHGLLRIAVPGHSIAHGGPESPAG
jgi:GNAT superfamily N-acetyltransferase